MEIKKKLLRSKPPNIKSIFKNENLPRLALVIILTIAIFFRFANTPIRYSLGEDSTRDALVAIEGARELQFPLTGPFSSLGPFTFGPWYYYQLILFTLITQLDYAPWIYLGIASVLFVFVMYKIGDILLGDKFGLLIATLVALSPTQIASATGLSNPNLISIFAGLSVLIFIKLIREDLSYWWSLIFGLSLGVGINLHYQMSGLLIMPIILLFLKKKKPLYFFITMIGIFITFLPLLFFDLNNHWYTLRNMFFYYTEGRKAIYVPNRWLFYLRDFWPEFYSYVLGVPIYIGTILLIAQPVIIGLSIVKRKLDIRFILLLFVFGFNFILLRYYWGVRGAGYLQYLHPFIFIFTTYCFWVLIKIERIKYIGITLFVILVLIILPKSINELHPYDFNVEMHRQANLLLHDFPDKSITLYNCKDIYRVRIQALTVLLLIKGKISDSGEKVGLGDIGLRACQYPNHILVPRETLEITIAEEMLRSLYPKRGSLKTIDLAEASEAARLEAGWTLMTPKIVFDSTVRWWFNEKP